MKRMKKIGGKKRIPKVLESKKIKRSIKTVHRKK